MQQTHGETRVDGVTSGPAVHGVVPVFQRADKKHLTVSICTYCRPDMLQSLLQGLKDQETAGLFTYSVLVVDNDRQQTARTVVEEFAADGKIRADYYVQPEQNIALARNKAIAHADGDFIVFIDDDEVPIERWLLTLYETWVKYDVDGVLGPVHPRYTETPPQWVVEGKFYDRRTYPTGTVIDWRKGRTGNTFLKKDLFAGMDVPFRPEFRTGEDQDFFRRVIAKGHKFVWCNEAVAYEWVPPIRWDRKFLLRRALLRGHSSLEHPTSRAKDVLTSLVAAPAYTMALPFAYLMGQGKYMSLLVRLCDHVGRLMAALGINPVKDPYVTT